MQDLNGVNGKRPNPLAGLGAGGMFGGVNPALGLKGMGAGNDRQLITAVEQGNQKIDAMTLAIKPSTQPPSDVENDAYAGGQRAEGARDGAQPCCPVPPL